MLLLWTIAIAHAATPFGGVEWHPLSRADLAWVEESRTSGVAVGEFDGTARPDLEAFGGLWFNDQLGLSAGLGMARLQNTTELDSVIRQRHWGVVRPSIDARIGLGQRREQVPFAWLLVGAHGDIPSARDVSVGYTPKEQKAADEIAYVERGKLGGFGGRLGIGAEYDLRPGLALGAQYAIEWHRGVWRSDDLAIASQWVAGEASLLLMFRWPKASDSED
ncbi:MAG: hypothetical protein GWP91_13480 [Rhodobacterales bacterium]|nr:hypothetical protein [Rhodobacterales bacterium]